MTTTAICVNCERTVYLEENQIGSCPVCSAPVIAALPEPLVAPVEGYYLG